MSLTRSKYVFYLKKMRNTLLVLKVLLGLLMSLLDLLENTRQVLFLLHFSSVTSGFFSPPQISS